VGRMGRGGLVGRVGCGGTNGTMKGMVSDEAVSEWADDGVGKL
jgi:hypothetical protein